MEIDYDSLFYFVDNFCVGFEAWYKKQLLRESSKKRDCCGHLSLSEILTILLSYHQSGMACFKYFYLTLQQTKRSLFSKLVHYARFVKLIGHAFLGLVCLLKSLRGEATESICLLTRLPCLSAIFDEKRNIRFLKV